jgi:hypothetical protein
MAARLEGIFEIIAPPTGDHPDKPIYAVMPIPGYESYFIGKDHEGYACLLVATSDQPRRLQSPIRLENLDVQFDLRCHLRSKKEVERVGTFTVIRCRSLDGETVRYFLSVCDTIVGMVGDKPKQREVASAVHRLAAIFQKLQKPPARPVNGLFGELYLIWRSGNPSRAVKAWRVDESARFDFADGNIRMDVKATAGRLRAHTFSYEQCNPPPGTIAIVASLFTERSPDGISLRNLVQEIETLIAAHPDLILKLHEVLTTTLGASLTEALAMMFDPKLAHSSLKFYSLREIPAIRGALPVGVGDVHFRSDISGMPALSVQSLIDQDLTFQDLVPSNKEG